MASIGSIFAEQLRRAKEKLAGDPQASLQSIIRRQDAAIQRMAELARMQAGEIERLKREIRTLAGDYLELRKSIVREVVLLEGTNGGEK